MSRGRDGCETPGSCKLLLPRGARQDGAGSVTVLATSFPCGSPPKMETALFFFGEVEGMCSREAELPADPAAPVAAASAACVHEGAFGP